VEKVEEDLTMGFLGIGYAMNNLKKNTSINDKYNIEVTTQLLLRKNP